MGIENLRTRLVHALTHVKNILAINKKNKKMKKEVKKVEDFRDEWVMSESIKNELLSGTFDEKKYVGRLISWGNTAFEITEVINHGFVIKFANEVIATNIISFIDAFDLIDSRSWDIVVCVAAIMAEYTIWSNQQDKLTENI